MFDHHRRLQHLSISRLFAGIVFADIAILDGCGSSASMSTTCRTLVAAVMVRGLVGIRGQTHYHFETNFRPSRREALRCLIRRLSDIVDRRWPGEAGRMTRTSSATDLHPIAIMRAGHSSGRPAPIPATATAPLARGGARRGQLRWVRASVG